MNLLVSMEEYHAQFTEPLSKEELESDEKLDLEFRSILSHALLGDEGGDKIYKRNFDLMVSGCVEFVKLLTHNTNYQALENDAVKFTKEDLLMFWDSTQINKFLQRYEELKFKIQPK